jgi:acetyl esterase/lipase
MAAGPSAADPRVVVTDTVIPGPAGELPVRIYRPAATEAGTRPGALYLHGGAFISGDLDTGDRNCRDICLAAGMWQLYLGPAADQYAAPARAQDLRGLPPAYLQIGRPPVTHGAESTPDSPCLLNESKGFGVQTGSGVDGWVGVLFNTA